MNIKHLSKQIMLAFLLLQISVISQAADALCLKTNAPQFSEQKAIQGFDIEKQKPTKKKSQKEILRKSVKDRLPCILKRPFAIMRELKEMKKLTKIPNAKNAFIQLILILFWVIYIIPLYVLIITLFSMAMIMFLAYLLMIAAIVGSAFFGIISILGITLSSLWVILFMAACFPVAFLVYLLLIQFCK